MKHRFGKVVALGATATLALSLGGVAQAQDKTVIKMIAAQYTAAMQPYFDQLSTSFEAANPQYDVQVEVVSWNTRMSLPMTRMDRPRRESRSSAGRVASSPALKAFVDYYVSNEGIAAVGQADYVDLPAERIAATQAKWQSAEG